MAVNNFGGDFHFGARLCAKRQPQHPVLAKAFVFAELLRLVFQTQPRSGGTDYAASNDEVERLSRFSVS